MKTPTANKTEIPTKPSNRNSFAFRARRDWQRNWELYVIIIPVLIYFILFQYKPMYGALIAFKNYKPALGFFGSPWVGLDNFTRFFTSPFFGRLVRNTLLLSFELLLFGFPAPIILALLINEVHHEGFKKSVQTLTYLPHFISLIVVVGMIEQKLEGKRREDSHTPENSARPNPAASAMPAPVAPPGIESTGAEPTAARAPETATPSNPGRHE